MDLNSNNVVTSDLPGASAAGPGTLPAVVARDSRHAPSIIHVRNLCGVANTNNVNLHQHQPVHLGSDSGHYATNGGACSSMAADVTSPTYPVERALVCSSPAGPSGLQVQHHQQNMALVGGGNGNSTSGWLDGIIGCFRPVFWNLTGKPSKGDDWEISYEALRDPVFIGSGAQGSVYKYNWRNEVVAGKMVKDKKETDVRHLRQLNHPNIIRLRGACTQPPNYCLVMEYCPNGTLYNYLHKEENQLSPRLTVDWSVQIASGMQYLHQHRIIHRDLKSPNILIAENNVLKISDFGTCRTWNDISVEMSVTGTYAWMAPEVIRKELCSQTVDVWSYGVVLWELLTSETPYRDVHHFKIIFGVGQNTLKLPLPPFAPAGFLLLMRMCWDPKPRNRPSFSAILLHLSIASAELVAQDAQQYAAQQQRWKQDLRSHYRTPVSRTGSASSSNSSSDRHVRLHRLDSSNNNDGGSHSATGSVQPRANGDHFDDLFSCAETSDHLMRCADEIKRTKEVRTMYEEKVQLYEKKLADVNSLYSEIVSIKAELEEQAKNKLKKPKRKIYKRYIVRPLQEKFINTKRFYSPADVGSRQAPRAVFLEVEEETGQPITVLAPASLQPAVFASGTVKRRSCRIKVLSNSQHRRSWSVGGSNVHQTMMRKSESHLKRLDQINEPKQPSRPVSSASSSSSDSSTTTAKRCSIYVDRGTQTPHAVEVDIEADGLSFESRRLKGDGTDSPGLEEQISPPQSDTDESEKELGDENDETESVKFERSRGRASGSSQRIAMNEPEIEQTFYGGPGRRYTVDMSQYKYNDSWDKRYIQPSTANQSPPYLVQSNKIVKAQTLPAQTNARSNLSRYSSWETCSEQEDVSPMEKPVFDASLRRRSLGRNPIRSRKSFKERSASNHSGLSSRSPEQSSSSPIDLYDFDGNIDDEQSNVDVCGNNIPTSSGALHLASTSIDQSCA